MSFWDLSDGGQVSASTEYEAASGGGVIPDDTDLMAFIDEIKWDEKDGNRYISARWRSAAPAAYKNRVVFQKLWVLGNNPVQKDPAKRKKQGDNAKRMLAAIDANAGGGLMAINGIPTDEQLQSNLMNKMMVVKVKVWTMQGDDGKPMDGNWICAISPKSKGVPEVSAPSPQPKRQELDRVANGTSRYNQDDEIPF